MRESTGADGRIAVADARSMPTSTVKHEDTAHIAECFDGRRLPLARSVYFAIVQLVAEAAGDRASASRKELALMAGVSVKTLGELSTTLEELDLIHVLRRREDGINLPNVYVLGPAPVVKGGGVVNDPTLVNAGTAAHDTQQSSSLPDGEGSGGEGVRGSGGERENRAASMLAAFREELATEAPDLADDAVELLRRKERVGGRQVTMHEMGIAAVAIHTFNVQAGRSCGLAAHLAAIVGRVRERSAWTPDVHVRLVESAFRLKWWDKQGRRRGGRVTPAVIYGNPKVFEQVIADAEDEKAGRDMEPTQRMVRTKETPIEDEL